MALDSVDVCVVGSGAGGAPMALQLGRAGFKVVVLEKGAHYQAKDFVHDEILNSRRNFFMPLPWDEPHLLRAGTRAPFARTNEAWTANCVGGGTVHMSGYFYRLKPVDFRLLSELGAVKGSTLADWPITYAELAPFYDLAEEELGVSGNAVPHPFLEPRKGNYPLPPLEEHPIVRNHDVGHVAANIAQLARRHRDAPRLTSLDIVKVQVWIAIPLAPSHPEGIDSVQWWQVAD